MTAPAPDDLDLAAATPPATTTSPTHTPNLPAPLLEEGTITSTLDNNLVDIFSPQEQAFLSSYLASDSSPDTAMIAAGYGHLSKSWRYQLARKLVQKYERSIGDPRKVFRAVGLGEVAVARKIKWLMDHADSHRTQLAAAELAAKALRVTTDQPQIAQGIQIIINTSAAGQPPEPRPDGQTGETIEITRLSRPATPTKPLQITK